jgi:hypothetical protein
MAEGIRRTGGARVLWQRARLFRSQLFALRAQQAAQLPFLADLQHGRERGQDKLGEQSINGSPRLGRVQEQLVSSDVPALQRHRVAYPQSAMTEQQHKSSGAASILSGTVLPSPALSSIPVAVARHLPLFRAPRPRLPNGTFRPIAAVMIARPSFFPTAGCSLYVPTYRT